MLSIKRQRGLFLSLNADKNIWLKMEHCKVFQNAVQLQLLPSSFEKKNHQAFHLAKKMFTLRAVHNELWNRVQCYLTEQKEDI